ncbi:hypothetical protein Y032_0093g2616 [Ancylostoma ceylanicum]|uniref:Uncharacterized protein n=1 Tax=Ancylostoma ceylanicum TaxID=53326 RepID=A0A016TLD0_9BILA|nr:hypothetical protein Y032_0093g2616 [Ancylostoma ceylanicum]
MHICVRILSVSMAVDFSLLGERISTSEPFAARFAHAVTIGRSGCKAIPTISDYTTTDSGELNSAASERGSKACGELRIVE